MIIVSPEVFKVFFGGYTGIHDNDFLFTFGQTTVFNRLYHLLHGRTVNPVTFIDLGTNQQALRIDYYGKNDLLAIRAFLFGTTIFSKRKTVHSSLKVTVSRKGVCCFFRSYSVRSHSKRQN